MRVIGRKRKLKNEEEVLANRKVGKVIKTEGEGMKEKWRRGAEGN